MTEINNFYDKELPFTGNKVENNEIGENIKKILEYLNGETLDESTLKKQYDEIVFLRGIPNFQEILRLKQYFGEELNYDKLITIFKENKYINLDYLNIFLYSFKEKVSLNKILDNIDLDFNGLFFLKEIDKNISFELLLKSYKEIIGLNKDFNFAKLFLLKGIIKDLSVENILKILRKKNNFDFGVFVNSIENFRNDLDNSGIYKPFLNIEFILKYIDVDFSALGFIKTIDKKINFEEAIKKSEIIKRKKPDLNFSNITNIIEGLGLYGKIDFDFVLENIDIDLAKFLFLLSFNKNEDKNKIKIILKSILEKNPKFDFNKLNDLRSGFNGKLTLDFIQNNSELNYEELLVFFKIFGDINVAKNNLLKFQKLFPKFGFERFELLDEIIKDLLPENKEIFLKNFLDKILNPNYALASGKKYLGNNNEFRNLFNNEEEFKEALDIILNLNILSAVRKGQEHYKEFLKDDSINTLKKLLTFPEFHNFDMRLKVVLARNLYLQNKEINIENVNNEYLLLKNNLDKYSTKELFRNRNIIFTAHHQDLVKGVYKGNDQERFGKKEVIKAIKNQGVKSLINIHPENNYEELKEAKDKTLKLLENTPPPMTFMFDGHGGPDSIYLSDGDMSDGKIHEGQNTYKIDYKEFAEALIKRSKKFDLSFENMDILIFGECYNQTFIRKVNKILIEKGIQLPISIGESEYNQLSWSDFKSDYGSNFYENILELNNPNSISTIGTIFKNEEKSIDSNPSVFVPNFSDQNKGIGKQIGIELPGEKDFNNNLRQII